EKTFGLARTRAGCDDGRLRLMTPAGQSPPGPRLMFERMKRDFKIERRRFVRIRGPKRASQLRPGPFEQPGFRVGQKTLEGPINVRVAEIEGRLQIEQDLLADVFGQMNREHVFKRTSVVVVGSELKWLTRSPAADARRQHKA